MSTIGGLSVWWFSCFLSTEQGGGLWAVFWPASLAAVQLATAAGVEMVGEELQRVVLVGWAWRSGIASAACCVSRARALISCWGCILTGELVGVPSEQRWWSWPVNWSSNTTTGGTMGLFWTFVFLHSGTLFLNFVFSGFCSCCCLIPPFFLSLLSRLF